MTTALYLWYAGLGMATVAYILRDIMLDADRDYHLGLREHALSAWVGTIRDLCVCGVVVTIPLSLWVYFSGA